MRKYILVVDDTKDLRDLLKDVLESEGYEVAVAGDGLEALKKIEAERRFDLILLDMMMPRMNGFVCIQEMQQRGPQFSLPVIVMSADERAPNKLRQTSVAGFLSKPFDLDQLLSAVEQCLACTNLY